MSKVKTIVYVVIINVVIFTFIEILLLLLGVGDNNKLIQTINVRDEKHCQLNPNYLYQYYPKYSSTIPGPSPHLFSYQKPDSVFRVLVIGESGSQGFPYSKLEAFPFQIQQNLNKRIENKHVEVINMSIAATTSYIGSKIAKEAVKIKPDLAIIYYGNNEFIGIRGAGTADNLFFKLNVGLSQLRLYQMLKSMV